MSIIDVSGTRHCLLAVDAYHGGRWLSPLRPGGVQPSGVPRNFISEPCTWDLFRARMSDPAFFEIGDNIHIDIEFKYDAEYAGNSNFFTANAAESPASILQYNTGSLYWYSNLFVLKSGAQFASQLISSTKLASGKHTLHLEILSSSRKMGYSVDSGAVTYVVLNEVQYNQATALINTATPESKFDGSIEKLRISNVTKQCVIIEYPSSWIERVRLLTYNNVSTANGVFEAADKTKVWGVKTPMDFRGRHASFSVISKVTFADTGITWHPVVCQGLASNNTASNCFALQLQVWGAEAHPRLHVTLSNGSVKYAGGGYPLDRLLGTHVLAGVYDIENLAISLYLDGQLLQRNPLTEAEAALALKSPANYTRVWLHDESTVTAYQSKADTIHTALIYNTALSESQIAAISKQL